MNDYANLSEVAYDAVSAELGEIVDHVDVEPTADLAGDAALRLTVHLKEGALEVLNGDELLAMLVRVRRDLDRAGEPRQAIVEYRVTGEIDDDADPES